MKLNEINIDEDLLIDPENLDVALVNQPNLLFRYSSLSAEQDKRVKEIQERIKTKRSELIKLANSEPEEYLGEGVKPTAPVVESFYRTQPEYVELKEELIEAEYKADMLRNAVFAIYTRRQSLDGLIKLLSMEYFSGPSIPQDLASRVTEDRERAAQARSRIERALESAGRPEHSHPPQREPQAVPKRAKLIRRKKK